MMPALLAARKEEYFLAWFAPFINGCNLSRNRLPESDAERFHLSQRGTYVWSHAPLEGITFYPTIRYKGMEFWPRAWKPDTSEPILHGMTDLSQDNLPPDRSRAEMERELLDAGWKWEMQDGLLGYVHVDELEKIEGPPPDGPF